MRNWRRFAIDKLNSIIKDTVDAIEKSRDQIFEIAESARIESKKIEEELNIAKAQTSKIIDEVDILSKKEKDSRYKLMIVSKNIKEQSENDIREAYDRAKDMQVGLMAKRIEEQQLMQKRTELERRLKAARETVKKAEQLVSKVGVVMGYLSSGLQDLFVTLEDIKQKQYLGVKIIKAQEEERQRVARDIHDGPAQLMTNVVLKADLCQKLIDIDKERAKEELENLKYVTRSSLADVRKIIYDLRPMSLDDLGLIPTVDRYIKNYINNTGIEVDLHVFGDERQIKNIIELASFRIIQEAMNNIQKHANARHVAVKLEFVDDNISIIVSDDGNGFNKDKVKVDSQDSGYGLISMKERVELLNGKFDIASSLGKGTKIFVTMPLQINEGG